MELYKCILLLLTSFAVLDFVLSIKRAAEPSTLLTSYAAEVEASRAAEAAAGGAGRGAARAREAASVRALTDYRVLMLRRKERILEEYSYNDHDDECLKDVASGVEVAVTIFLESEILCTHEVNSGITEWNYKLKDARKEVRDWRRGLLARSRGCSDAHPADYAAAMQCLHRQVDSERYDTALTGLILTLKEVQGEFLSKTEEAKSQLEECLEETHTDFLQSVGRVVEDVTLCREENKIEAEGKKEEKQDLIRGNYMPLPMRMFPITRKCFN